MGQDTRSIFQYLKDAGYDFIIGGFHVKGQVIDSKGVAAWGYGGQTVERGDWKNGKPSPNPADQVNAWKKQTVLCEHELPGTAKHDPLGYLQNRTVDWLDHQLAARELLEARRGEHGAGHRARVPAGAHPGQGAAEADPEGLDRLRAQDRRGGRLHVRASPRGAAGAGHPGAGARARRLLDLRRRAMAKRKLNVAMIGYDFMGRAHSNAWRQVGALLPGRCRSSRC